MSVTLARQVRRGVVAGEPLPDVYPVLARAGIHIRRAGISMVAGKSGTMKTMWALDLVRKLQLPTLYNCNDSDEATVAGRLVSSLTQRPYQDVCKDMIDDPNWAASHLAAFENIRWCFDPSPSLDDIDLEVEAFAELYGEYPWLIVVDILKNVSYYEDTDHSSVSGKLKYLHTLARSTKAAVLVIHHCSEGAGGGICPPRSAILEKQNELPELQLTVGLQEPYFFMAPVKYRHGPSDPSGYTNYRLKVDPSTGQFWGV